MNGAIVDKLANGEDDDEQRRDERDERACVGSMRTSSMVFEKASMPLSWPKIRFRPILASVVWMKMEVRRRWLRAM